MSVIRVGTTKKFADNWENIFGGKKKSTGRKAHAQDGQEVGEESHVQALRQEALRQEKGPPERLATRPSVPSAGRWRRPLSPAGDRPAFSAVFCPPAQFYIKWLWPAAEPLTRV